MRLKAVKNEAAQLVHEHGVIAALETVQKEMKQAKRSKNWRLVSYKTLVATEVSRRSGNLTVKDE